MDWVCTAIADPTRRAIIKRLSRGPATISEVAAPFPMTLTGFCKHVRVLERAGLVRRSRQGREKRLALQAGPLREVAQWLLHYEQYWTARLDRLEAFLSEKKGGTR
jgi:DNA-binding transcriptional ArsR family regulator